MVGWVVEGPTCALKISSVLDLRRIGAASLAQQADRSFQCLAVHTPKLHFCHRGSFGSGLIVMVS